MPIFLEYASTNYVASALVIIIDFYAPIEIIFSVIKQNYDSTLWSASCIGVGTCTCDYI